MLVVANAAGAYCSVVLLLLLPACCCCLPAAVAAAADMIGSAEKFFTRRKESIPVAGLSLRDTEAFFSSQSATSDFLALGVGNLEVEPGE